MKQEISRATLVADRKAGSESPNAFTHVEGSFIEQAIKLAFKPSPS